MSARQFTGLFLALSLSTFGVAVFAWSQGNAFAPAFALLDAAFIAAVLRWVWRQGDQIEVIALDERHLEVRHSAQGEPPSGRIRTGCGSGWMGARDGNGYCSARKAGRSRSGASSRWRSAATSPPGSRHCWRRPRAAAGTKTTRWGKFG